MTDPAPGAAPYIQGYWARAEGTDRPKWHQGHRDPAWIAEWNRGWNDADIYYRRIKNTE